MKEEALRLETERIEQERQAAEREEIEQYLLKKKKQKIQKSDNEKTKEIKTTGKYISRLREELGIDKKFQENAEEISQESLLHILL